MWGTVLLMGVAAGLDPARIAAVVVILSRPRPVRLFVAYFIGGFGVSLIVGVVVLFVLRGISIGSGSSVPPEIEIAVGALAIVVSGLVATGLAARLRDKAESRLGRSPAPDTKTHSAEGPHGIEQVPGFEKLPQRAQAALKSGSPWVAWIAGVAVGMPSAYYLAAIAAILNAGASAGTAVAALLLFNVVAFALTEVPMVGFVVAPDATRARVDRLYGWSNAHHQLVVAALAGIVGIYLLVVGISKL